MIKLMKVRGNTSASSSNEETSIRMRGNPRCAFSRAARSPRLPARKHEPLVQKLMSWKMADSGNTSWVLTSSALVMLMTPALALFYGGFVSEKAVVNTMMMSFSTLAVISVLWSMLTYSLAFSPDTGISSSPFIGSVHFGFYDSTDLLREGTNIPEAAFMMFQLMFAVITCAVISGSVVERISLWAFLAFAVCWHVLVYVPLARWVFSDAGWMNKWGVLDFAGGLVVETASGVSAFVLAYWIGPAPARATRSPHNVPYILLGAGLLFFGWFGFNAGSALASGYLSSRAFANTHLCASSSMIGWACWEYVWSGKRKGGKLFTGKVSAVGAATGAIVGLVSITPACGFISQMSAVGLGFIASLIVYHLSHAVHSHSGVDDSLDCFGGHGLSGIIGTLWVGLFSSQTEGSPRNGAFYGDPSQFGKQLAGVAVTVIMCIIGTTVSFGAVSAVGRFMGWDYTVPFDPNLDAQHDIDGEQHGEKAYVMTHEKRGRGGGAEDEESLLPMAS